MNSAQFKNVSDIVRCRLCLGCGACIWSCKERKISLYNFLDEGIRPLVKSEDCGSCRDCLKVCPVFECDYVKIFESDEVDFDVNFQKKWGPIVGLWEGYAVDHEIRFRGASGGVLTALSLYCLEQENMYGVLHTGPDPDNPVYNRTRMSRRREELIHACGSRYSAASVCNGFSILERASGPCVVIGRPVEIVALQNATLISSELKDKLGLTMSFFCAESPSMRGTIALLSKFGLDDNGIAELRYRGHGWPGEFMAFKKGQSEPLVRMSYQESWGFLQAYRPWSVQLWPDGTGELADISCGDPWYRKPDGKNPGLSLVIARTLRGKEIIERAIKAGYLELEPAQPWKLEKSQWGLFQKKCSIWGRRLALRLMGLPVSKFKNLPLFSCWLQLSQKEKAKSILSTIRRIIQRRLYRPLDLSDLECHPVPSPIIKDV
uniref:Coenzyme F420 hydrogenase n=1 Tax=candidate division CPR3 bacterium TaxID=2268181 RepID=A0A7V3JAF5_UNCC3